MWHFVSLPLLTSTLSLFCQHAIYQCAISSICHFANLPICQFANMSICQCTISSICHFDNLLSTCHLSICHFSTGHLSICHLSTCHLSTCHLSTCHLSMHHFINMPFWQHAICQHAICQHAIRQHAICQHAISSMCFYVNVPFCQLFFQPLKKDFNSHFKPQLLPNLAPSLYLANIVQIILST